MAKNPPIAPATNTSPMTESLGGFTPLIPDLNIDEEEADESEEPDEESWWDSLFDEEEEYDEPGITLKEPHLSTRDFKDSWNRAGREHPNAQATKSFLIEQASDIDIKSVMEKVDEESELVPIEPEDEGSLNKKAVDAAIKGGFWTADAVSSAYGEYTPDVVKPYTDMALKAGGILLGQTEYLDVFRSEAWTEAYDWADWLPDTDTRLGDFVGDAVGKSLLAAKKVEDFVDAIDSDDFDSKKQEKQYYEDIEALGKNIYSAFADAKLYDKAINTKGYFVDRPSIPTVLHGGNATGQDLLDIAFPIDMMKRLNENAPKTRQRELDKKVNPTSTAYIVDSLSDPVTRMGWGLALEVIADPLWFAGPAKGAKTVYYADKAHLLSEDGVRVAGHLERYTNVAGSGSFHQKTVAQAIVGGAEEANKARSSILEVVDAARKEAKEAFVRADRLRRLAAHVIENKHIDQAIEVLKNDLAREVDELKRISKNAGEVGGRRRANRAAVLKKIEELNEDIGLLTRDLVGTAADATGAKARKVKNLLMNKSDKYRQSGMMHRAAASEMETYVNVIRRSAPATHIVEKSRVPLLGTWHVPFSKTSGTIGTTSDLKRAGEYVNQALGEKSFLITTIRSTKDSLKAASQSEIAQKVSRGMDAGMKGFETLSQGEKLAWLSERVGQPILAKAKGAKRVAGSVATYGKQKAEAWTYGGLDMLARMVGTRHWQAMFANEALRREISQYGARGALLMSHTASDSHLMRLRRLNPETWNAYQDATTNYMKQLAFYNSDLNSTITSAYHLAGGKDGNGGVLREWKKQIETTEIPEIEKQIDLLKKAIVSAQFSTGENAYQTLRKLERRLDYTEELLKDRKGVLSNDYGVDEFINDIFDLIETGAGKLDELENAYIKSAAEKIQEGIIYWSEKLNKPREAVEQTMIALARSAGGDINQAYALTQQLYKMDQLRFGAENVPSQSAQTVEELTNAWKVRVDAKKDFLDAVDEDKLVEILYRTLDVSEGMPFNEEVAQAINNAVVKALGGDQELANQILVYAAAYYGDTPEKALRFLALEYSGESKRIQEQIKAGKLRANWPATKETPTADPHPFWSEDIPLKSGVDHTTGVDEFAHLIKDKELEHVAMFDDKTGKIITFNIGKEDRVDIGKHLYAKLSKEEISRLQREQKLRDDVPPDEFFEKLTELVANGEVVMVHNHPQVAHKTGIFEAFSKDGLSRFPELAGIRPTNLKNLVSQIPPSIADMKITIAMNAKYHIVANPDGTAWIIKRPKDGWPFVDNSVVNFRDRIDQLDIELDHRALAGIEDDMRDLQLLSEERLGDALDGMIDELEDLNEAFNAGFLSKPQYDVLRQNKVNSWTEYLFNNQMRVLGDGEVNVIEEYFGIKPYRVPLEGRYKSKPALLLGDAADSAKIERRIVRDRIKTSIKDEKIKTKTSISEIRSYRLNPETVDDPKKLLNVSDQIKTLIRSKNISATDEFIDFINRHSFPSDAAEDAFFDDLVAWIETDYPEGTTIPNVSRSSGDWLAERAEFGVPETVTPEEIDKLKDAFLETKEAESLLVERLNVLTKAFKRLDRSDGPLTKKNISKESRKIRTQRVQDVLQTVVAASPDTATVKVKIREALDELLDLPNDEFYSKIKDDLAKEFTELSIRKNPKFGPTFEKVKDKGRKLVKAEFDATVEKLKEAIPHIKVPDAKTGEDIVVALKDWEYKLWKGFKDVTYSLTPEESLMAAYAALAESPKLINPSTVGQSFYDDLTSRYGLLVGRRMGELPETLKPVKEAFSAMIQQYEDMYLKHGMHFVKNQQDMLRYWGVIDYVPHLPAKIVDPNNQALTYFESLGRPKSPEEFASYNTALENVFGKRMDSAKRRSITGTMKEINDRAAKPIFEIDPSSLIARYMASNKAMSGQDFMLALVSGNVIKPFSASTKYRHQLEVLAEKYGVLPGVRFEDITDDALRGAVEAKATAKEIEMLASSMKSQEMISGSLRAAALDYVPLFKRAVPELSNNLIISGTRGQWLEAGLVPDNIAAMFKDVADYKKASIAEDRFATFTREAPVLKEADSIIAVLSSIKAKNFKNGDELFDPVARQREIYLQLHNEAKEEIRKKGRLLTKRGKSADQIRTTLIKEIDKIKEKSWSQLADEMNGMVDKGRFPRIKSGGSLKDFYETGDGLWNLWAPAVVKQSMDDLFVSKDLPGWAKKVKEVDNFFKLRLTVIATAFHSRNVNSNVLSNLLTSGVGTLDVGTNFTAGRLAQLAHINDRYGSVEEALRIFSLPKGKAESKFAFERRLVTRDMLKSIVGDNLFDLGDGIYRTSDDAIKILNERGVVAGSFQQYVDIAKSETNIAELYAAAGVKEDIEIAKKTLSGVEDVAIVLGAMQIAGSPIPLGLPKRFGSYVGRSIENQARITNFITNTKSTQSFDTAAKIVDETLFNYNDLTTVQKMWMRLFVPFFTWSQKNIVLQAKMMAKKPVFYSQFSRLMVHQGPEIVERYNAELAGTPYVEKRTSSPRAVALRNSHARNYIKLPVPGMPGYYVEGLGTPQEALFEELDKWSTFLNPKWMFDSRYDGEKKHLRALGSTSFTLKLLMELASQHQTFYNRPISENTNGQRLLQQIESFRLVPGVGNAIADALRTEAFTNISQVYSPRAGTHMEDAHIDGNANYIIQNVPWSRVMSDASAAGMLYNMSYLEQLTGMDPKMRREYLAQEQPPLPDGWKILDALGNIRIIVENDPARIAQWEYKRRQRIQNALKEAGVSNQYTKEYLKEQQ